MTHKIRKMIISFEMLGQCAALVLDNRETKLIFTNFDLESCTFVSLKMQSMNQYMHTEVHIMKVLNLFITKSTYC